MSWLYKISLELFFKVDDGVATKSLGIPRKFITQIGKTEQQSFLVLYRARGSLQLVFHGSSLDNRKESKRAPIRNENLLKEEGEG